LLSNNEPAREAPNAVIDFSLATFIQRAAILLSSQSGREVDAVAYDLDFQFNDFVSISNRSPRGTAWPRDAD
jgi:hypothetical protein